MDKLDIALRVLQITSKYDECESVWWRTDGVYAPVTFLVNCNDLFYWACSDAEEITQDNIDIFEASYADAAECVGYGEMHAGELFCCRVRGMRPQGAYYEHIIKNMWELFDACGPYREVDAVNPKPHPRT